jgi:hypothetical protein
MCMLLNVLGASALHYDLDHGLISDHVHWLDLEHLTLP